VFEKGRGGKAGIARGGFRNVDPRQTALTLVAMTVIYFTAALDSAGPWRRDPLKPPSLAVGRIAVPAFVEHPLFAFSGSTR